MPEPFVQINQINDVLPVVVKWLGIGDPNFPDGSKIAAGAPYTLKVIKNLIFQADYEIALLVVGNLEHPFRTAFVTGETDFLPDGALIPPHAGPHSRVTIKVVREEYGEQIVAEELGTQRDYSRLKRLRRLPQVYGEPRFLYAIFGGRLHFADQNALGKLDIPVVAKDENLETLISPLPYFWGLVGKTITTAAMRGFDVPHRRYWMEVWQTYLAAITGGAVAIPEPEQLERIGT